MTRSLTELLLRKQIAEKFIEALKTDEELLKDPRQPDALQEYEAQLESINSQIKEIEKKDTVQVVGDSPEPIIIGLKTAKLSGKSGKGT